MAPSKKRQPHSRAPRAAKRGKKSAAERRFTPEDYALIVDWADHHRTGKTGKRISWKGCAEAHFSGRDPPVTDDDVRFAWHQIGRNHQYTAAAKARRLNALEDAEAHELRRWDALRRFAELTDPNAMAQLHTCSFCERAVFPHEIHKSPKPAFSAAADKERGNEPSTYTVKQLVDYLDGAPEYTTIYQALDDPEPEADAPRRPSTSTTTSTTCRRSP